MRSAHLFGFKAFPLPDSHHFRDYVGAVITSWVSTAKCKSQEGAEAYAIERLRIEGWIVVTTFIDELVSVATYAKKKAGRQEFLSALEQGSFSNIVRQPRRVLGTEMDPLACRTELASVLASGRAIYTMKNSEQFANGVIDGEVEFVPVWSSHMAAAEWSSSWPDFEIVPLAATETAELCAGVLDEEDLYVGVGGVAGIVLFHAGDILTLVDSSPPPIHSTP